MAVVEWTAEAEEDLIDIWLYIAQDNPQAADGVLDAIDARSNALAASPYLGAARPELYIFLPFQLNVGYSRKELPLGI